MKKIKLITSVICISLCSIKMNAQNYRWTTGGSSNTASITPKKSTMDISGNSIIAGQYQTAVDMDFANGAADTFFLYPKPIGGVGRCVFFAKYDQDGKFSWAKRLYNPRSNTNMDVTDVATDDAGNIYLAGSYTGWCDFNPSDAAADTAIKYSTQSGTSFFQSMYVAKYDVSGNFVWVMNLDGGVSALNDIAIRKNTLYVTGETRTTTSPKKDTDFDPSELPADTLYFNGSTASNAFFAAYDLSGDLKTAKRLNNNVSFTGRGIDADSSGNIYVTGSLMGVQDFNPSNAAADTAYLIGNTSGVFLAKYDTAGVYKWAKRILENSNYTISPMNNWVHITQDQSVYTVGYFKNKVDFDPKPDMTDTLFLNAGTGTASYIARYAVNGDFKNAYAIGDTAATKVANILGISSDDSNYLYIAGQFNGKTDFNLQKGAADTLYWSSVGNNVNPDIFFAKYANDTLKWSRKVGNSGAQLVSGLGVNNKHLTIFGNFAGDVIFDPMPPVNIASQLIGDGTYLASYRTFPPSSEKKLLTYAFSTPPATGTITGDTVFVTVPFGTALTALVANFTVSPKAIALVGTTLQVSGTTPNNFTGIVTYTIMAEDSTTRDYFVKVKVEPASGINEVSTADNNTFKVWPNPAADVLHFEQYTDVKLYDINGKQVLSATEVKEISVSHLAAGVYILENRQGQKQKVNIR